MCALDYIPSCTMRLLTKLSVCSQVPDHIGIGTDRYGCCVMIGGGRRRRPTADEQCW
jgi:hypothetical protein